MQLDMQREILTATEVAAFLRVSRRQVYAMAQERTTDGRKSHPLPSVKFGGCVRFLKEDVIAWILTKRSTGSEQFSQEERGEDHQPTSNSNTS